MDPSIVTSPTASTANRYTLNTKNLIRDSHSFSLSGESANQFRQASRGNLALRQKLMTEDSSELFELLPGVEILGFEDDEFIGQRHLALVFFGVVFNVFDI